VNLDQVDRDRVRRMDAVRKDVLGLGSPIDRFVPAADDDERADGPGEERRFPDAVAEAAGKLEPRPDASTTAGKRSDDSNTTARLLIARIAADGRSFASAIASAPSSRIRASSRRFVRLSITDLLVSACARISGSARASANPSASSSGGVASSYAPVSIRK